VSNITLNLCRGGLQEVVEAKHLEVTLVEYEIAYRGSVGDVSLSINISGLFTSVLGSSTSWVILVLRAPTWMQYYFFKMVFFCYAILPKFSPLCGSVVVVMACFIDVKRLHLPITV
jgi:hypothetical protein